MRTVKKTLGGVKVNPKEGRHSALCNLKNIMIAQKDYLPKRVYMNIIVTRVSMILMYITHLLLMFSPDLRLLALWETLVVQMVIRVQRRPLRVPLPVLVQHHPSKSSQSSGQSCQVTLPSTTPSSYIVQPRHFSRVMQRLFTFGGNPWPTALFYLFQTFLLTIFSTFSCIYTRFHMYVCVHFYYAPTTHLPKQKPRWSWQSIVLMIKTTHRLIPIILLHTIP